MKQLPPRPSLEHLKAQAKELLRAYRAGTPDAFRRLRDALPAARGKDDAELAAASLRLRDAQSCLAREYGFASWPDLKAYVELAAARADDGLAAGAWFRLVYGGGYTAPRPVLAERALDELNDRVRADAFVACALGDVEALRRTVAADAGWVQRPGGPLRMPPLIAVTFSGMIRLPHFAPGLRACARLLLDSGADCDAGWVDDAFPGHPLRALYGAAGKNGDPEMTRLLLDAGADPNDGESLYHSAHAGDVTCMRMLLEAGATVSGTNALFRILDFDNVAGLELLLAHGGEPDETVDALNRPLHHAIRRGRSLAHVDMLLAAGADPSARTATGVPAALLAVRHGRPEIAQRLGLDAPLSAADSFVAACARADREGAGRIASAHPGLVSTLSDEQLRLLPLLAQEGRGDAVETMLALGWPVAVRGGDWEASALNFAVFRGDARLTRTLLEHGASWTEEHGYNDNVAGTLSFASSEEPVPGGDWVGCARELIAHGMPPPPQRYAFSDDVEEYFATLGRGAEQRPNPAE